jgi:hypothetical protein
MLNKFQTNQIVCIENKENLLYAQVIQVISERQTCWLRPLMLIDLRIEDENRLTDLRETTDLILPESLLRFALDTEVIPLLMGLEKIEKQDHHNFVAKQSLNKFIKTICQTHQTVFHT